MKQQIPLLTNYQLPKQNVAKLSDKTLIAKRAALKAIIKEATDVLTTTIDPELFKRASKYPNRKYGVDNATVLIVARPNFSAVPLSFAKRKGAIKQVIDGEILTSFYKKGGVIPGLTVTEFVTVR